MNDANLNSIGKFSETFGSKEFLELRSFLFHTHTLFIQVSIFICLFWYVFVNVSLHEKKNGSQ